MKPSDFTKKKLKELFEQWESQAGTQVTLAAASGVKQGQISDWTKGLRVPAVDGLTALSRGFGVPVSSFFPPEAMCPPLDDQEPSPKKLAFVRDIVTALPALDEEKLALLRERVLGEIEALRLRALKADAANSPINASSKIK